MFVNVKEEAIQKLLEDRQYDVFDSLDEAKDINPMKSPSKFQFTYGTDWKENLLNKAGKLGVYKELLIHVGCWKY